MQAPFEQAGATDGGAMVSCSSQFQISLSAQTNEIVFANR
jgi:hypothetical protein